MRYAFGPIISIKIHVLIISKAMQLEAVGRKQSSNQLTMNHNKISKTDHIKSKN